MNRCIPNDIIPSNFNVSSNSTISSTALRGIISTGKSLRNQAVSDLLITWPLIAILAGVSVVFTLLWILLMQFMAGIFVWATIVTINLVFITASFWLVIYWQVKNSQVRDDMSHLLPASYIDQIGTITGFYNGFATEYQVQLLSYGFYIILIMTLVIFLVSLAMIKRIKIAIAIIQESSRAVSTMPTISTEI